MIGAILSVVLSASVISVPKGDLYDEDPVVTNVDFSGIVPEAVVSTNMILRSGFPGKVEMNADGSVTERPDPPFSVHENPVPYVPDTITGTTTRASAGTVLTYEYDGVSGGVFSWTCRLEPEYWTDMMYGYSCPSNILFRSSDETWVMRTGNGQSVVFPTVDFSPYKVMTAQTNLVRSYRMGLRTMTWNAAPATWSSVQASGYTPSYPQFETNVFPVVRTSVLRRDDIHDWALQPEKPSYTPFEIGTLPFSRYLTTKTYFAEYDSVSSFGLGSAYYNACLEMEPNGGAYENFFSITRQGGMSPDLVPLITNTQYRSEGIRHWCYRTGSGTLGTFDCFLCLPHEGGTIATREWAAANASPADYANVSNAAVNARNITNLIVYAVGVLADWYSSSIGLENPLRWNEANGRWEDVLEHGRFWLRYDGGCQWTVHIPDGEGVEFIYDGLGSDLELNGEFGRFWRDGIYADPTPTDDRLAKMSDLDESIDAANPTFSNAVLAVRISTNDFAALYALKESFDDMPIDPVTGGISIGALLAALASAVAWLKKNKRGLTDFDVMGEVEVVPSGDPVAADFPSIKWYVTESQLGDLTLEWNASEGAWIRPSGVGGARVMPENGAFKFYSVFGDAYVGGYPQEPTQYTTSSGETFFLSVKKPASGKVGSIARTSETSGIAKFGADGVLEKATEGVDYLKTHQDISGKQDKILETGVLKGGGAGAILPAIPSSSAGELADYRDPTDNVCHKTELTEWTLTYSDGVDHHFDASKIRYYEGNWHFDGDNAYGDQYRDENATEISTGASFHEYNGYKITATRSTVATKDKPFGTADIAARSLECGEGDAKQTATVENGVAKLDDFFTESNTLLAATIDARLPYPLYTVPSTGLLKDRAINTTSLASVIVPDNFTDLLIRASVASSLSVTMPEEIATKYGDTFPGEAGEYLITITKTGAAEAYVRTIKLEEVANA